MVSKSVGSDFDTFDAILRKSVQNTVSGASSTPPNKAFISDLII